MEAATTMVSVLDVIELFMIATVVAVFIKFVIKIQYMAALVIAGVLVGLTHLVDITVSADIIYYIFLPIILFEGGLAMHVGHLRDTKVVVTLLAFPGLILAMILVGYGVHVFLGIPLLIALLFGAIIMPTDPVSVLATFKRLGAPPRLTTIIEAESVLNDGAGIVAFGVVMAMIHSGVVSIPHAAIDFVTVVVGGIVVGVSIGYLAYRLLAYIDDHLVEITVTILVAFSSFLIAEHFEFSGIIAVVFAGLIVGNYAEVYSMSPSTRFAAVSFWEVAVFLVNSLIFLMIGIELTVGDFVGVGIGSIVFVIVLALVARALIVYGTGFMYWIFRHPIPLSWQHVLVWGGLHATVPLALALSISPDMPERNLLLTLTLGVVFFSLIVQGMSMDWVSAKLGLIGASERKKEYEYCFGMAFALRAGAEEIKKLLARGEIRESIAKEILEDIKRDEAKAHKGIESVLSKDSTLEKEAKTIAMRKALLAERGAIRDAMRGGLLSQEVGEKIIHALDEKLFMLESLKLFNLM